MAEIDDELIKTIRHIQIESAHLAEGLFAGAFRSAFKGKGIEFEDIRDYQSGDEIGSIDWNNTAKRGNLFVKNFREEREHTVMLIVDASSSTRFGSTNVTKNKLIAKIGALLAFSAIKNNDKVGLIIFSDTIEKYLSPKKGTRHVLRVIRDLLVSPKPNKGTDLAQALAFLGKVQRRPAICFIISDFFCPDFKAEYTLLAKKHDLIPVSVIDPLEASFPNVNLAVLTDLETAQNHVIDTGDSSRHQNFMESSQKRIGTLKAIAAQEHGGIIDIRTDQSYLQEIEKFFKKRSRRTQ